MCDLAENHIAEALQNNDEYATLNLLKNLDLDSLANLYNLELQD